MLDPNEISEDGTVVLISVSAVRRMLNQNLKIRAQKQITNDMNMNIIKLYYFIMYIFSGLCINIISFSILTMLIRVFLMCLPRR